MILGTNLSALCTGCAKRGNSKISLYFSCSVCKCHSMFHKTHSRTSFYFLSHGPGEAVRYSMDRDRISARYLVLLFHHGHLVEQVRHGNSLPPRMRPDGRNHVAVAHDVVTATEQPW